MRILHLVLYSPSEIYDHMREILFPWNKRFDTPSEFNVTTLYYFFDPDVTEITIQEEDGIMRIPGKETFMPGILDKTILAFQHFFEGDEKKPFDYVVRSNISTVVNFPLCLQLLRNNNRFFFGGPCVMEVKTLIPSCGLTDTSNLPFYLVCGNMMIFHADAIRLLLSQLHLLCRTMIDDISISLFFKQLGGSNNNNFIRKLGSQYLSFSRRYNVDKSVAFRNQNNNKEDRTEDMDAMKKQIQALTTRYLICPGQQIHRVFYHTKDVTPIIVSMCKQGCAYNKRFGEWKAIGDNLLLDATFGDPAPGTFKRFYFITTTACNKDENNEIQFAADWVFLYDSVRDCLIVY